MHMINIIILESNSTRLKQKKTINFVLIYNLKSKYIQSDQFLAHLQLTPFYLLQRLPFSFESKLPPFLLFLWPFVRPWVAFSIHFKQKEKTWETKSSRIDFLLLQKILLRINSTNLLRYKKHRCMKIIFNLIVNPSIHFQECSRS